MRKLIFVPIIIISIIVSIFIAHLTTQLILSRITNNIVLQFGWVKSGCAYWKESNSNDWQPFDCDPKGEIGGFPFSSVVLSDVSPNPLLLMEGDEGYGEDNRWAKDFNYVGYIFNIMFVLIIISAVCIPIIAIKRKKQKSQF